MILSVAMLLQWMGDHHGAENFSRAGDAMTAAVDRVLEDEDSRKRDLDGTLGCRAFGARVAQALQA
jgi:3-isopropylmalate dehydrogenase